MCADPAVQHEEKEEQSPARNLAMAIHAILRAGLKQFPGVNYSYPLPTWHDIALILAIPTHLYCG
jgi:hypothetical protein